MKTNRERAAASRRSGRIYQRRCGSTAAAAAGGAKRGKKRDQRRVYWRRSARRSVTHETHLSAEEAQTRSHTWFPRSDAHARGAPDAEAASRQGPQATDGLMQRTATPPPASREVPAGGAAGVSLGNRPRAARSRLSRSADFERVFRQGRSHAGRELVLYVFPRADGTPARLGLSVSRKVGGAVERNRVKRLLREAFVLESERLPPGTDVVVVARREARALAEREGLSGVRRALSELVERAAPRAVGASAADGLQRS